MKEKRDKNKIEYYILKWKKGLIVVNTIYGIVICIYFTVIGIRIYKLWRKNLEEIRFWAEKGIEMKERRFIDMLYEAFGFHFNE